MIHPVVLAVLVTAALGLFLAAVSVMLLHTVKGHRRHHDQESQGHQALTKSDGHEPVDKLPKKPTDSGDHPVTETDPDKRNDS